MSRENDEQMHGLYVYTPLEDVLSVENIISFHYYEYARHYIGFMESHDFWEMVYVNSGTIQCNAGSQTMELVQGQAIFHPPMEQHQLVSVGKDSSIFIISFTCLQMETELFRGRVIQLDREQQKLISSIYAEGQKIIKPPYNELFQPQLTLFPDIPYGSMQILRNRLEMLIILLQRSRMGREEIEAEPEVKPSRTNLYSRESVVNSIVVVLKANLGRNLCMEDIAQGLNFSPGYLQKVFREEMNMSVMKYYRKLKIEEAKTLISRGEHSVTEISEMLGFSSVHHFSNTFSKMVKMTPTEYRHSVLVSGLR